MILQPHAISFKNVSSRLLKKQSVVIVDPLVCHRVGAFGFLSTGDNVIPGNNGLKDVVVALKWVQENIQKFGGDSNKVTAWGESAGGAAVHYLLLSPTTKGLFHRAISASGTVINQWAFEPNPRNVAVELATYLNCPTTAPEPSGITSEEILTCLKGVSADELNRAQFSFRSSWPLNLRPFYIVPSVEPSERVSTLTPFLSETPISILSRKDSSLPEIPWMVGCTEDEGAAMYADVVLAKPELLEEINSDWENLAPKALDYWRYLSTDEENQQVSEKLKQFYFGDSEITKEASRVPLANLYTDIGFLHGVYRSALETASRGKRNPVYFYQYAYKGPISLVGTSFLGMTGLEDKVSHGDDLQHLFDISAMMPTAENVIKPDTPDEEFSKNLVRLWASFAIHGEPKHSWGNASLNKWKPISKKELDGVYPMRWYRIEETPSSVEINQSVKDRIQLWDDLWKEHFTPAITKDVNQTPSQKTEL